MNQESLAPTFAPFQTRTRLPASIACRGLNRLLAAAWLLLAGTTALQAATITKLMNTTAISSGGSWNGGAVPGIADIGLFDSTITNALTTANAGTVSTFGSLQFTNIGGPVTIGVSSSTTITLNNAAPTYVIDMSAADNDVTFGTTAGSSGYIRWNSTVYSGINVASGRRLTFNSTMNNAGNTKTVTMTGGGNIVFNSGAGSGGAMGFSIQGGTTVTMNGVGSWSGGSSKEVKDGTLNIGNDSALGSATLTMGGTSSATPTLAATGGSHTITNSITLTSVTTGNATIAGTNNLTVNGTLLNSGGNRTLTVNNSALTTFGGGVNLSEGAIARTLTINGSGNTTISGAIINGGTATSGNLTYSGTGTLALSGTNTYSGATLVTAGRLLGITGGSLSNTTSLQVGTGAAGGVRLAAADGQWTVSNFVASGASTVDIDLNGFAPSTTTAPLVVLGNLDTTNTMNFIVRGSALPVGTYPLVKYGAQSGTLPAVPQLLANRASGYLSNDLATTIYLVVTNANAEPLTWTVGTGNWDTTTTNWVDAYANAVTYEDPNFDRVLFDDVSGGGTVTIAQPVRPVSVTFSNDLTAYTLTGTSANNIFGTGALYKYGTNTLTVQSILDSFAYTGGTYINAGTLNISYSSGHGFSSGNVIFTGDSTLGIGTSSSVYPYIGTVSVSNGVSATINYAQRCYITGGGLGGGSLTLRIPASLSAPSRDFLQGTWAGFTGTLNVVGTSPTSTLQSQISDGLANCTLDLSSSSAGVNKITFYSSASRAIGALTGTSDATLCPSNTANVVLTVGGLGTSTVYDGLLEDYSGTSLGLTKVGSGSLTLTASSGYSGVTTISNGTLVVNGTLYSSPVTNRAGGTLVGIGTIYGPVALESGSTVAPGGIGAYGTLTLAGGLYVNGGTNYFDVSTTNSETIVASGSLYLAGGGVVRVNVTDALTNGNYPLISYSSIGSGSVANLSLTPTTAGGKSLSLVDDGFGQILLQVSAVGSSSLTWLTTGVATNNYWDLDVASLNWTNSTSASITPFVNGDNVTFNDSGAANSPVDLRVAVSPKGVVVNSSAAYTFSSSTSIGQISGTLSNGLTKSGSGTLTILTKNNYTGPTLISSGTVQVGDGSALNTAISSGNVTNNARLIFNQPDESTVAGDLTGSGSLVKQGGGTLILAGNVSFTGTNLIDTGTLQLGNGGAMSVSTNSFVLANQGTLAFNRSGNYVVSNSILGAGNVVFTGNATNVFGGVQAYTDNTHISNGVVKLASANVIPHGGATTGWLILDGSAGGAGTLDLNGFDQTVNALAGLSGTVLGRVLNNGGAGTNWLVVDDSVADTDYYGLLVDNNNAGSGRLGLVKSGVNTLNLRGANTFSGGLTNTGGVLGFASAAALGTGPITLIGGGTLNALNSGLTMDMSARTLTVPSGQNGIINMPAVMKLPALYGSGSLGLNVTGGNPTGSSGQYGDALTSCTNFTGVLNVTNAGTSARLVCNFNNNSLAPYFDSLANARVNLYDGVGLVGTCGSGGTTAQFGELNVDSLSTLNGSYFGGTITYQIGALNTTSDIQGNIVNGTAASAITKVGSGSLLLNGSGNTYTGNTTVNGGSLVVGASGFMNYSPTITVASNAVLDVSAAGTTSIGSVVPQTLTGYGAVKGNVSLATASITPGASGAIGTLTFSNNLAMTGNVTNRFDIGSSGTNDQIVVVGTLNVSGSGNVLVLNPLNTIVPPATFTLVTFASTSLPVGDVTGQFTLAGSIVGQVRSLSLTNTGTAIQLVIGPGGSLVWTGDGTANLWDITNSVTWKSNSTPTVFYQFDRVTFDDSSSNQTVNLTGTLLASAVTVSSTSNYAFTSTGKISGSTSLLKQGAGTLSLVATNDYLGGTTNTGGGTIDITNKFTALGSGPLVSIGATLQAYVGSSSATLNNAVQLAAGTTNTFQADGAGLQYLGGPLSGSGRAVVQSDQASKGFDLLGTNSAFTGVIELASPVVMRLQGLESGSASAIWDIGAYPGSTLAAVAGTERTLALGALQGASGTLSGHLSSGTGTNVTWQIGALGLNTTFAGAITNGSQTGGPNYTALDKVGAGTLVLSGNATHTGPTTINGGKLQVDGTWASSPITVVSGALGGNGTLGSTVNVQAGGTLDPGASVGILTVNNTLTLAGDTRIEVNKTLATNDQVVVASVNYGGTLTVVGTGTFAAGDSYPVFIAGATNGNFASIVGSPGAGLGWSFNPSTGVLSVVGTAPVLNYTRSGNVLQFNWTGSYKLQAQTNALNVGLKPANTNWFDYPGGGTGSVSVTNNPANPTVFFRLSSP